MRVRAFNPPPADATAVKEKANPSIAPSEGDVPSKDGGTGGVPDVAAVNTGSDAPSVAGAGACVQPPPADATAVKEKATPTINMGVFVKGLTSNEYMSGDLVGTHTMRSLRVAAEAYNLPALKRGHVLRTGKSQAAAS